MRSHSQSQSEYQSFKGNTANLDPAAVRGMGEGSASSSPTPPNNHVNHQPQQSIDYQALFREFQAQQISSQSQSPQSNYTPDPPTRSASRTGKERAWYGVGVDNQQQQQQQQGNGVGMQGVDDLSVNQHTSNNFPPPPPPHTTNSAPQGGGGGAWHQEQAGYVYTPTPQDHQRYFGNQTSPSPGHQRQTSYEFQDYRSRVSLSPQPPASPYFPQTQQPQPQQGYYNPSPSRSPLFPPTHSPSFTNNQLQPFPPSPSHFPRSGPNSRSHSPNFPPTLAAEDFSLDLDLDLGLDLGAGPVGQEPQQADESVDESGWGFPFAGAGGALGGDDSGIKFPSQGQQEQVENQGQVQGNRHQRTDSHTSSYRGSVPPSGYYGSPQQPQQQHGEQEQGQNQASVEQGLLDLLGLGQQGQAQQSQQGSRRSSQSQHSNGQETGQQQQGQQGDMVYRDMMAGPGSLLLPSSQNQQMSGQPFGQQEQQQQSQQLQQLQQGQMLTSTPNSAPPGRHFFPTAASSSSTEGIIYGEPGSFDGGANNLHPSSSQTIAPPLVQRRVGKDSLGALKDAYAGVGSAKGVQSQFARRMNSESSETDDSVGGSSRRGTGDSMSLQSGGYDPYVNFQQQQRQQATLQPQPAMRPQPTYMNVASPLSGFSYQHLQNTVNVSSGGNSNKPQSPPQLIIPDSPMAQPAQPVRPLPSGDQSSRPKQPALNTLFPPPNPQIPYGAYLPNMSPVGPGGPSINIVPSTPTSALKEGVKGMWERMAIQAAQANRGGGGGGEGGDQGGMMQVDSGGQPSFASGLGTGYGSMGRRRASHAGIFTDANGRPQLSGTPQSLDLSQQKPDISFNQPVPGTAPPGTLNTTSMPRPMAYQPHRQRSRSESHINAILPTFAAEMGQEEMQRLILESWMTGDGSVFESQGMNEMEVQSTNQMDYVEAAVPVINPMALGNPGQQMGGNQNPGGPSYHMNNQLMDMPQFSPFGQGNIHSAPAWQNSHVVPGPESYGANFIMTNDGRRVDFGGVSAKGMSTVPSQIAQMGGHMVPASPARSDDSWTMEGAQALEAIRRSRGEGQGHRRHASSEDYGQYAPAQRWLSAEGNDTANFLDNIVNPMDGSLVPPRRGSVSHPRPAPSIASIRRGSSPYRRQRAGSNASSISAASMSQHQRSPSASGSASEYGGDGAKPVRTKVTTPATEMASKGRRMNDGQFLCPVPGCGSTFTRHFNLKGHLRSHNEERPFECTYPGCTKSFARKHDCNRHMQLHVGLKPFVCEGCQRTFARLDALSRHHKTEAGIPCAISHPLPTNPDGSLLSESKYRAEMARREVDKKGGPASAGGAAKGGRGKKGVMM